MHWLQQLSRVVQMLIGAHRGAGAGFGWHASLGISTLVHAAALGTLAFCFVSNPKPAESVALDSELKEPLPAEAVRIDPPVQDLVAAQSGSTPGGREGLSGPLGAGVETALQPGRERKIVALFSETPLSPLDFASPLPSKDDLVESALGTKLGKWQALGGGLGRGMGAGQGDGNGAEFFELQTEGTKFVYVLDGSGSMTEPHKEARSRLERVKIELLRSIGNLPVQAEFFVIFFNQNAVPMPAEKLQPATLENKRKYLEWCMKVKGGGQTDPREAIKQALKLEPDVIYLLTDGVFTENIVGLLKRTNTRGVVVNTFCFGDGSGESQLIDIAKQNDGTYRFIP